MKIALITTTINVPRVLELYREIDDKSARYLVPVEPTQFFVAGDEKTPAAADRFCRDLGYCTYLSLEAQSKWKLSSLIGFNNDSRRNFALLEALRWGAEIIVSVDDDMIPVDRDFFHLVRTTLLNPFSGLKLSSRSWLDTGQHTVPPARARGLPLTKPLATDVDFVVGVPVGVMQGTILGVPDADALVAGSAAPRVTGVDEVLRAGFVVGLDTPTVFDSQVTAFCRELAPAFAQFYRWQQRNTDIFASVLMRRIMRGRGLYTHFGPPMAYHARAWRHPLSDLKAELFGLERIAEFSAWLEGLVIRGGASVLEATRSIYKQAPLDLPWWPDGLAEVTAAWCDDCEEAMA